MLCFDTQIPKIYIDNMTTMSHTFILGGYADSNSNSRFIIAIKDNCIKISQVFIDGVDKTSDCVCRVAYR